MRIAQFGGVLEEMEVMPAKARACSTRFVVQERLGQEASLRFAPTTGFSLMAYGGGREE